MNNNGVNNSNENIQSNVEPTIVQPNINVGQIQQPAELVVQPIEAPVVVQQPVIIQTEEVGQTEQPTIKQPTEAVQQNIVEEPKQQEHPGFKIVPPSETPQVNKTTYQVQQPQKEPTITQPATPQIQVTKEGVPINHPQMIINGADKSLLNQINKNEEEEQPIIDETKEEQPKIKKEKNPNVRNKKKENILTIIIVALVLYTIYSFTNQQKQIQNIVNNLQPLASSNEEKELDINSTIVQELYSKVETNIREDVAQPNFDNTMKLYLAYRQILDKDKYDSNCNMFTNSIMEPYKCEVSLNFVPKAFKQETLERELKILYGEDNDVKLGNIKLDNSCIGGYAYIKEREEFVEGYCDTTTATSYKVTKTLKKAVTNKNEIVLKEEVKYHENEKMNLPSYLKSGTYYYTFRLDMNYNWVFVNKTYEEKY